MGRFPMCPDCNREYHDIENRRYHAQPDACPVCVPHPFFLDGEGRPVSGDPIETARTWLKAGKILAVKGLGGVHLACRADDPALVLKLRRRKERDEKPFALMCRDAPQAAKLCYVNEQERRALESPAAPIVLLKKRPDCPENLSETGELGILLPYTPVHHLLLREVSPLVMTSMNRSDRPVVCRTEDEGWKELADGLLKHDREIVNRCDDSLLRLFRGEPLFFRRSRGYAPATVALHRDCTGVLALGAEQKGGFAFVRGREAFLSQHIGDLKDYETEEFYVHQIDRFQHAFDLPVRLLVCDLHPDYRSTAYARERSRREGLPLIQAQHHHAHMASCMADNGLQGQCIGLVWDGTGYGTDATIWGAECLAGDYAGVKRLGSIQPIPLPGGDRCALEIGRTAHGLLTLAKRQQESRHPQGAMLSRMIASGTNAPRSSGMGRLFDGVYALLTGRERVSYEGQGAVLLEAMAAQDVKGGYPLSFFRRGDCLTLDTGALVNALLEDGRENPVRAARFMNTLSALALAHAEYARQCTGLNRVVLSGGVFHNDYLLSRTVDTLTQGGFVPYVHRRVSPGDQGIPLGQVLIGAAQGG
jgi:hydrogenase maturation protein HypF